MTNLSMADQLEQWARMPEYAEQAAHYRELAEALRQGQAPHMARTAQRATGAHSMAQMATNAATQVESRPIGVPLSPVSSEPTGQILSETPISKQVDVGEMLRNVNVLLFVGAFLVVVSVMILVGSNFEAISDAAKMLLVALGTGAFYGGGLWLFTYKKKLRPAAVTFTMIGMLLIPLMGVAYRNLLAADVEPSIIWFVTSLISAGAYYFATKIIRQSLLQYAVILALLSSLQSGLLALDAPVQVLAWAALAFAGAMLYFDRNKIEDLSWQQPVGLSAMILIPITIVASLWQDSVSWQFGLTLGLSAVFYLEAAWLVHRTKKNVTDVSIQYFAIGSSLLAIAPLVALLGTGYSWHDTALIMSGVGCAYLIISALADEVFDREYQNAIWITAQVTAAASIFTGVILYEGDLQKSLVATVIGMAFYGLSAWRSRRNVDMSVGFAGVAFVLLGIAGRITFGLEQINNGYLPLFYLGLGFLFSFIAKAIKLDVLSGAYSALLFQFSRLAGLASVVSLLLYSSAISTTQTTLLLIVLAVFYLYLHGLIAQNQDKKWQIDYITFLVLSQLAVFSFGVDIDLNVYEIGGLLTASAILLSGLGLFLSVSSKAAAQRGALHAPISLIIAALGGLMALGEPDIAAAAVALAVASQIISFAAIRSYTYLWFSVAGILALPFLVFGYAIEMTAETTAIYQQISLAFIAVMGFFWRTTFTSKTVASSLSNNGLSVSYVLYNTALILLFMAGVLGLSAGGVAVTSVLLAGAFWFLSEYEQLPGYHVFIVGLVFVVTVLVPDFTSIDESSRLLVVFASGALQYTISLLFTEKSMESVIWRIGSVIGLTAALFADSAFVSIAAHFMLALIVAIEAYRLRNFTVVYVAIAAQVLALNRLLFELGYDDLHLNSMVWSAYAASLAWLRHRKGDVSNRDGLLIAALIAQTIPLGLQALDPDQAAKGILLLIESAIIMVVGFAIRIRLLIMWGATVIIAQVLYQSRSVIDAIPKQVFTLLIGMALLGVAIYYLSRTKDEE